MTLFQENIEQAKHLTSLYEYLEGSISSPFSDDLLRAQIVYSVSAFDKLLHDIIRIGIIEIFTGKRPPTPKYLAESISIATYNELMSATKKNPKEHIFEEAVFKKLKTISYQEPEKVAEGLSYIWNEKQKWQQIALKMELDDKTAKNTLKLIADRRNSIVHEADIKPGTNKKYSIHQTDIQSITDFLGQCGKEIVGLVVLSS
ncbi:MAG: hypothetical protein DSM107014_02830 [Gomphosphaeria aponina SAG 52.96 = DSM 107014]|uniref:RiboL-PSP-HEPN domain-containing protein n=1 Tax=Gomphosphaeria aponina SAG 52.96 = DSM 107014 TaxID=1521640 RepID=A0A941GPV4_9CHRO|nr:hypothetical protein [Gomphosphaeria aponina SAG 52.96 = DSM 107014]